MTRLLILTALFLSSACTKYSFTHIEDHPAQKVTRIEALKTTDYFVSMKVEHQFYLCKQVGSKLSCKVACNGDTDLTCPGFSANGMVVSTNVR